MTLPAGDPNEAVTYSLGSMTATLLSGDVVPVTSVCDEDGDEIEDTTMDNLRGYEKLFVVAGPVDKYGLLIVFAIHPDDRPVVSN